MQQSIIEAHPDANIQIQIVWGSIRRSDLREHALARAAEMRDPRVTHYWDPEELVGIG